MKKIWAKMKTLLPFLIILAVLFAVLFFPKEKKTVAPATRVLRLWNVDTFEGGRGSRTAFLRSVARRTEKKREGLYVLVTNYTKAGAEEAFMRGECPDMLSFGVGLSSFMEKSLPLPFSFAGGTVGGDCLAVPWCRGEYALYSLTEEFDLTHAILSSGGCNLVEVAAALGGIAGEKAESNAAYIGFLDGKYSCLLGTQRDACRFSSRGVNVFCRPLPAYCDLYQYISVLSPHAFEDAIAFIEELLSGKTQEALSSLGMQKAEGGSGRTISVFSDTASLNELSNLAAQQPYGKNLEKFLKTI